MSPDRVRELFDDARELESLATNQLEAGDIRDAAEKAWGATKRAADALILAHTNEEPRTSGQSGRGMRRLRGAKSEGYVDLYNRYFARQAELHGNCFYDNNCEPVEAIEAQIRETSEFIQDCQRRADAS